MHLGNFYTLKFLPFIEVFIRGKLKYEDHCYYILQ